MTLLDKLTNSLTKKILIAMFVFLLGLWSLALYLSSVLHEDMERLLADQQFATLSYVASEVDQKFRGRMKALEVIAETFDVKSLSNPRAAQKAIEQHSLLRMFFNYGVQVFGPDGKCVATLPHRSGTIGVSYLDREYIVEALRNGKSTVGQPLIGKLLQSPEFVMAVPIRDSRGAVIGVLSGLTHLERPSFLNSITNNQYGKTGDYILLSPQHRLIVTSSNKRRIMEPLPRPGESPLIDRVIDGFEGSHVLINPLGIEVLASAKKVPTAGWIAVAILPTKEAFAPAHHMRNNLLWAMLFISLYVVGIFWWIIRFRFRPVVVAARSLTAMSEGLQPLQTLPVDRQDEIGQLISGFNRLMETLWNREKDLVQSEARLNRAEVTAKLGHWELHLDSNAVIRSKGAIGIYESDPQNYRIDFATVKQRTLPEYRELLDRSMTNLIEHDLPYDLEYKFRAPQSGQIKDIHVIGQFDKERRVIFGTIQDITEQKLAEKAVRLSEERYRSVFRTSMDLVAIAELSDGRYLDVNEAFLNVIGYTREEVIGRTSIDIGLWEELPDRQCFVEILQKESACRNLEVHFRKKSGQLLHGLLSATLTEIDGITYIVSTVRDITEIKQAEERIKHLAFFDQLTGLPNRALLHDRLCQNLAASSRNKRFGAVLRINLDGFKKLNDSLGTRIGDQLLRIVAQRLIERVRADDTVARLGGDEFVVMLTGLSASEEEAAQLTELVVGNILSYLGQGYLLDGDNHDCKASIGATLYRGLQHEPETLLKQADFAMRRAKDEGGDTLRFFDSTMEAVVMQRACLEKDLRQAITEKQFILHYQAQVSGGQLVGAEVLLRWRHPARGFVSPGDFIPLAEETGLILPLGQWVLQTACEQLAAWETQPELAHLTIAVNVSASQFRHDEFVDQVASVLHDTHANPYRLKLELTESMLVSNVDEVIGKIFALKAKGISFSLDDFGTGYSSLSYLKRLPLDQLKIDQSFIRDVLVDPNDASITRTIISLGRSLGLNVIAEGVETREQRDFLSSEGCLSYQGYFVSRPIPVKDFEQFVRRFHEDDGAFLLR